ncbi:MAG: hypothetical protein ABIP49_01605 [Lysobacterales bacterium]
MRTVFFACVFLAPLQAHSESPWRLTARLAAAEFVLELKACARGDHANVVFSLPGDPQASRSAPLRQFGALERVERGSWRARAWRGGECATFSIDLAAAARLGAGRIRSGDEGFLLVAPQDWLWLPDSRGTDATIEFDLPESFGVSVPWRRLADTDGRPTYALDANPLDGPALTAFGAFEERVVRKPGGVLRVAVLAARGSAFAKRLDAWIDGIADVALTASGRLPLRDAQILVVPIAGSSAATPWGEVQRGGGSALHLYPGAQASAQTLREDWTATHEISHLLHPYLGTRGRWLGEGLASYYQNVLRARAGWMSVDAAVASLRSGFARGRRDTTSGTTVVDASRQMHQTRNFMQVYWTGAAYWLGVDARLRRAHNTTLDAVLARYSECCLRGGDVATSERFIATLDRLSDTREFSTEFDRASRATTFPDAHTLDALLDDPALRTAIFAPR